ncbi:MAG: radical SAM protein [Mariprofundaceae bacterium]|nr:radical SAM protein [Mariprofundaceae bacterium]
MTKNSLLNTSNHDRDSAAMHYVYPVVSRRAGGVSIGINLNPNNRCNWHCLYCQVPQLQRGHAPDIDITRLHDELHTLLDDVLNGTFMRARVPTGQQQLCDIAFSGNGEPTSSQQFEACMATVIAAMHDFGLHDLPLRLITNGSYMRKLYVQTALQTMAKHQGEVWIKVDACTEEDIARINGVRSTPQQLLEQVAIAANHCPTWIQSCFFHDSKGSDINTRSRAWLDWLRQLKAQHIPIQGVLLYGLARPSMQPEAAQISMQDDAWMADLAQQVQALGIPVKRS